MRRVRSGGGSRSPNTAEPRDCTLGDRTHSLYMAKAGRDFPGFQPHCTSVGRPTTCADRSDRVRVGTVLAPLHFLGRTDHSRREDRGTSREKPRSRMPDSSRLRPAPYPAVKLARLKPIEVPAGICLQCFNSQQQFTFPFIVYCPHSETLALVRSTLDSTTFPCKPAQLPSVLAKLSNAKNVTDAIPPAGDRL